MPMHFLYSELTSGFWKAYWSSTFQGKSGSSVALSQDFRLGNLSNRWVRKAYGLRPFSLIPSGIQPGFDSFWFGSANLFRQ